MNKQSLTTQPNKALRQTGQPPTIILNNKPFEVVAVVGIRLGAQDLQIVPQPQAPPQPTTINVQVNNYNCSPPEAPKQGHSGSSPDAHLQGPQTTASVSRGNEDKAHGVKNKPSAPNTRKNPQEKTQNGSEDKVNSTRTSQGQTVSTQNKPGIESNSAPITKSATTQMPSRPPPDGRKTVAPVAASVSQVQRQGRKENSQLNKKKSENILARLLHSDPSSKSGSQGNGNAATSATTSPPRGNINNHQSGSGGIPSVRKSVGHGHPQPARHSDQAPAQSVRHPAPHNPVLNNHHGGSQSTRRGATVSVPHSHTPVNQPRDERAEAVPEAKALSEKVIKDCEQMP